MLNDTSDFAEFVKSIKFNFPPDNFYRPLEFRYRRDRLPLPPVEKGAFKVTDDFTSFKKLTQLSSVQFQVKILSEKLALLKSSVFINVQPFVDMFNPQAIGRKQP
jgi:hypothetical protein